MSDQHPWERANVSHEEWVAALERTAQRALDELPEMHPDRAERMRMLRFAQDIVQDVESGEAETVALLLRQRGLPD